ncbi:MAG: SIR2 family protein [Clostridiales bacterium]|nr:SIR2 family protein [Clostridiales bacterium]
MKSMEEKYIAEIANALSEKHAAVMVGAGFSKNADKINATDNKFMDWNELSDLFYKKIYDESLDLEKKYMNSLRLAQEVEAAMGRPAVEKILWQAIPDLDYAPSEVHVDLMSLPWKDVFTTNYDTLLERAAEMVTNRRYNIIVSQEDLVNSNDVGRIIKLHGSFPSHRPFIITEEDYRTYPAQQAAMVNTVQQALLENLFCMIGFSCEDPNFVKWVGWIGDNLGKNNAQKIYMVSVTSVSEPKQRLLAEQNITVIDLEALWPERTPREKMSEFFSVLRKSLSINKTKTEWNISYEEVPSFEASYTEWTGLLERFRREYPGWIFLPWKMQKKIQYVLHNIEILVEKKLAELSETEQIAFIYEYLYFHDVVGRPVLLQNAVLIDKLITGKQPENVDDWKLQGIYLQLLRVFRESAQWEQFECYRSRIREASLNYDECQLLRAEECRCDLFRFHAEELKQKLEQWTSAGSDVYWPLIKAYFYAITGDRKRADRILMDNLVLVRKQLMKDASNPRLVSIEESTVSLLNFIRQSVWSKDRQLESCVHEGDFSWWNENEKYCLHLQTSKTSKKRRDDQEERYNFDLSTSHIIHLGSSTDDPFTALEYWRFLEQTGHSFRIGMVTNTNGLEHSVRHLYKYYPHWCLMQLLISQEDKYLDYLYGRVQLAGMSTDDVDQLVREYMEVFAVLIDQVDADHVLSPETIYEQAAGVMPSVLGRLCYKCSTTMLDQLLEQLLGLCISNRLYNFKKLKHLFKGILEAYTTEELADRLSRLLDFPMKSSRLYDYEDPFSYMRILPEKLPIDSILYHKTMMQIREALKSDKSEERNGASNRLTYLAQLIELKTEDKELLYELYHDEGGVRDYYLLYKLQESKTDKDKYLQKILTLTLEQMRQDANSKGFSSRGGNYEDLLSVMDAIDFTRQNIEEIFRVMADLLATSAKWKGIYDATRRIHECIQIAQGILISVYPGKRLNLSQEEITAINAYIQEVSNIYENEITLPIAYRLLVEDHVVGDDLIEKAWFCQDNEMLLLCSYVWRVSRQIMELPETLELKDFLYGLSEVFCYRLTTQSDTNVEQLLETVDILTKYDHVSDNTMVLTDRKLQTLIKETEISERDEESMARRKVKCRAGACTLASHLYGKRQELPGVMKWKTLHESPEEFIEIRKVKFEQQEE